MYRDISLDQLTTCIGSSVERGFRPLLPEFRITEIQCTAPAFACYVPYCCQPVSLSACQLSAVSFVYFSLSTDSFSEASNRRLHHACSSVESPQRIFL